MKDLINISSASGNEFVKNNFTSDLDPLKLLKLSVKSPVTNESEKSPTKLEVRNSVLEISAEGIDRLELSGPLQNVLDNLKRLCKSSQTCANLRALDIAIEEDAAVKIHRDLFARLTQLLLRTLRSCLNLIELKSNFITEEVASRVFPALFQQQKKLKELSLEFRAGQDCGDFRLWTLECLLTGNPVWDMPPDVFEWNKYFNRKNESIANLQGLEHLELVNTSPNRLHVAWSVFKAFSKMSSLRSLTFRGNFEITRCLVDHWLEQRNDGKLTISR